MNKNNQGIKNDDEKIVIPAQFSFLFPQKDSIIYIKQELTPFNKFDYTIENNDSFLSEQVNNITQRIDYENQIKHLNCLRKQSKNEEIQSNFKIIFHNIKTQIDCKEYFDKKRSSLYSSVNAVNMYFNIKDAFNPQKNLFNEYRIEKAMELSEGDNRKILSFNFIRIQITIQDANKRTNSLSLITAKLSSSTHLFKY